MRPGNVLGNRGESSCTDDGGTWSEADAGGGNPPDGGDVSVEGEGDVGLGVEEWEEYGAVEDSEIETFSKALIRELVTGIVGLCFKGRVIRMAYWSS